MLTACCEYRPRLIELARCAAVPVEDRALMAHVEVCADCARVLDEQSALSAALGGLAGQPLPDMARIEARVLAEFDRAAGRRRTLRWAIVAGLAAAVLIGLVALERRAPVPRPANATTANRVETPPPMAVPRRTEARAPRAGRSAGRRPASQENPPFVAIPYTVPLAPEERARIVRMEVPVAALIAAGYNVETSDPGRLVNAEVLVSQDGRARAIRLNSNEEEER